MRKGNLVQKFLDELSAILSIILMIILAGTAAYIKAYEQSGTSWPPGKHLGTWITKNIYAGFTAMLVWYGAQSLIYLGWNIPAPAIPFLIGIAAYSGAQVLDFAAGMLMTVIKKKLEKDTP
jgi:hypothetical protein